MDGVKVWMYDMVSPDKQYTVADYVKGANRVIERIHKKSKLPIIVGGTGLYLKALLDGLESLSIPMDQKLRTELQILDLKHLQERLQQLSKERWDQLNDSDKKNTRRLVRAIELSINENKRSIKSNQQRQDWDILKIGLTAPRESLYKNSDLRVLSWLRQGIIREVQNLMNKEIPFEKFLQLGLEYKIIAKYLNGQIRQDELVAKIQYSLHSYIRRQQTWFKKEKDVFWFDVIRSGFTKKIEKLVSKWYDLADA